MSRRDFRSSGFTNNPYVDHEDADPRVGLVNLADVMLVFACGLMLALVAYWNLNISDMTEVVQNQDMSEVSDSDIEGVTDLSASGSGFTELGTVYQDPKTGKMYMQTEDVSGAGNTSGNSSAESNTSTNSSTSGTSTNVSNSSSNTASSGTASN